MSLLVKWVRCFLILNVASSLLSNCGAKRIYPDGPQDGDLRLLDGSTSYNGRLEVYHEGEWGTVCDSGFDMTDAETICHELGYEFGAAAVHPGAFFGEGSGPIWLGDLECTDYTTSILSCRTQAWREHGCDHSRDVGVTCVTNGTIRLVGGGAAHQGKIEVFYSGIYLKYVREFDTWGNLEEYDEERYGEQWATIADENFTLEDANLICRLLNYHGADNAHLAVDFDTTHGWQDKWLEDIRCPKYSNDIASCRTQPWRLESTIRPISVTCIVDGSIRLVDGPTGNSGRVEVFYAGQWGTVCEDEFDMDDANFICQQLGFFEGPAAVHIGAYFGSGSGPIWLDNLGCTGNSSDLASCLTQAVGDHDCTHESDVGVTCATNPALRLVNGNTSNEGTVQFLHNVTWGTICGVNFGYTEANAVCRALGFTRFVPEYPLYRRFSEETGPMWYNDCPSPSNSSFTACLALYEDVPGRSRYDSAYCEHQDDVGVKCQMND